MSKILFVTSEDEFRGIVQPYVITLSHIDTLCSYLDMLDKSTAYDVKRQQVDCTRNLLIKLFENLLDKTSLSCEKSVEYFNYPDSEGISIWCGDKSEPVGDITVNDKIYEKSMELFNKFINAVAKLGKEV